MYPVNFYILDGDDYYEPNAISTLLNAYYKTNADLVIGEFTNVDEKTGERDRRSIFDKSFVITENATKKMTKVRDFDDMYFLISNTIVTLKQQIELPPQSLDF